MHAPRDKYIDELARSYGEDFTPDVETGLNRLHARLKAADGGASVHALATAEDAAIAVKLRPAPASAPRYYWLAACAAVVLALALGVWSLSDGTTTLVADGADLDATLPDGTEVLLQEGSRLSYGEDFNLNERQIFLEGQGFFEVAKDPTRPFLAEYGGTELIVTGTAFNLRIVAGELEVEVSEGSVMLQKADHEIPVRAMQCGLVKQGHMPRTMESPNLNRHAWRTGRLSFEDASLTEVLRTVCNNYGVTVTGAETCEFPISGTFSTHDPAEILGNIARLGGGELRVSADASGAYELHGLCAN